MQDSPSLSDRSVGKLDPTVIRMLEQVRLPICVTDPHEDDNPIVYVNSAFLDLTGYEASEVLNRNCRFLQGPETRPESVEEIRQAIRDGTVTTIEILNYRKDGSAFENALQIGPIEDEEGHTILHFGSQLDVTEKRRAEREAAKIEAEERSHRLRNIVNVMSVAIRLSAREATDVKGFAKAVTERLRLLGEAHVRTFDRRDSMSLRDVVGTVLDAYATLGDRQMRIDGPEIDLSPTQLTPATLALHELATNSVKHGALGAQTGQVAVAWGAPDPTGHIALTWTERGGPEVTRPERASGSKIIRSLVEASGGQIEYDWQAEGLVVHLTLGP